jgi:hypothetical protein
MHTFLTFVEVLSLESIGLLLASRTQSHDSSSGLNQSMGYSSMKICHHRVVSPVKNAAMLQFSTRSTNFLLSDYSDQCILLIGACRPRTIFSFPRPFSRSASHKRKSVSSAPRNLTKSERYVQVSIFTPSLLFPPLLHTQSTGKVMISYHLATRYCRCCRIVNHLSGLNCQ